MAPLLYEGVLEVAELRCGAASIVEQRHVAAGPELVIDGLAVGEGVTRTARRREDGKGVVVAAAGNRPGCREELHQAVEGSGWIVCMCPVAALAANNALKYVLELSLRASH